MRTIMIFIFLLFLSSSLLAEDKPFNEQLILLEKKLKDVKYTEARDIVNSLLTFKLSNAEWLKARNLLHRYPQIGADYLLRFDQVYKLEVMTSNVDFSDESSKLAAALKSHRLINARESVNRLLKKKLSNKQWFMIRDMLHQHPQIGFDMLLRFDQSFTYQLNKIDLVLAKADTFLQKKKFKEAAVYYQLVLKYIVKDKNYKTGRNLQLYWTVVHSLGRAFYGLKQYDDAYTVYQTIPSYYPHYKQVQFELMWNNYRNERLEYSLGNMSTMASGNFSKMLEPEVYLLQYYIYKRMCRDEEIEIIKHRVKNYNIILGKINFPLGNWIKKDVETLVYKQILQSGDIKRAEAVLLKTSLEHRMATDVARLIKEFALVQAHLELDTGKNENLVPVTKLLSLDQLLNTKNEKWIIEDTEVWIDELGKQVFNQKDLCGQAVSK